MDIIYLGHASFKIRTKSAVIVTDPFDPKMVGLKYPLVEADIVTVSHGHADHNAVDRVTGVRKVIQGPGEYEVSGVSILGYSSFHDKELGATRGKNTIYVFEADGLRFAHLGDLGHVLSDELVNQMGEIDVLMIPVGGFFTIGPKEASDVVSKIDPYFVLPMHYKVDGLNPQISEKLESVDSFIKEIGMPVENMPKFSIRREDIIEDQGSKVIVLNTK